MRKQVQIWLQTIICAFTFQSYGLGITKLICKAGYRKEKDLAQINKAIYPRNLNFVLYILAEIAIIATDAAEVLGMALGLKLLFGIDRCREFLLHL